MNRTLIYFNSEDFISFTLTKIEIPDVKLSGSGRETSIWRDWILYKMGVLISWHDTVKLITLPHLITKPVSLP